MDIEVKLDSRYTKPKVVIYTAEMSDAVSALLEKLGNPAPNNIAGFQQDVATILDQADIVRIFAESQKILAETETARYTLRLRLYEVENLLDSRHFVRISNSEIINLRMVDNLDLSFTGTICVKLKNGNTSYVSRRYVSKIKAVLGL